MKFLSAAVSVCSERYRYDRRLKSTSRAEEAADQAVVGLVYDSNGWELHYEQINNGKGGANGVATGYDWNKLQEANQNRSRYFSNTRNRLVSHHWRLLRVLISVSLAIRLVKLIWRMIVED
jgi:hypothetical protein